MTYRILISFFITLGIGLAIWTTIVSFRNPLSHALQNDEIPDAYMEEVNALIIDKQGKPSMKIVTPNMVHYTKNDVTEMIAPQLTLYRKSPEPWYITSKYATATEGSERVLFRENVNIRHAADTNNPATLIKTSKLLVHPNKRLAETTEDITMEQPNTIVKATGMNADLNTGDIKLLSAARAEYVPSS